MKKRFMKWQKQKWHHKRSRKTESGSQPVPETSTVDILAVTTGLG